MMTERRILQLSELWNRGVPVKWMARACHYAPTTIYHLACNNRDLFPARRPRNAVDASERAVTVAEIRDGKQTILGASKKYGVSRGTVRRWMKELG